MNLPLVFRSTQFGRPSSGVWAEVAGCLRRRLQVGPPCCLLRNPVVFPWVAAGSFCRWVSTRSVLHWIFSVDSVELLRLRTLIAPWSHSYGGGGYCRSASMASLRLTVARNRQRPPLL